MKDGLLPLNRHTMEVIVNLHAIFCGLNDDEAFQKMAAWMATPNPNLGGSAPINMLLVGRHHKLLRFIATAYEENKGPEEV